MDITYTIDLDSVAQRVRDAGFAACVMETGWGASVLYASREWRIEHVRYPDGRVEEVGKKPLSRDVPGDDTPRCDVAVGMGWFEGEGCGRRAMAAAGDLWVGPDSEDEFTGGCVARDEDHAVEAILGLLRALPADPWASLTDAEKALIVDALHAQGRRSIARADDPGRPRGERNEAFDTGVDLRALAFRLERSAG